MLTGGGEEGSEFQKYTGLGLHTPLVHQRLLTHVSESCSAETTTLAAREMGGGFTEPRALAAALAASATAASLVAASSIHRGGLVTPHAPPRAQPQAENEYA